MIDWIGHWGPGILAGLLIGLGCGWFVFKRRRPGRDGAANPDDDQHGRSRATVLHALARAARILFSAEGNDEVMPSALAVLGEAVDADRVYVFENHRDPDSGELLASMRYEWCGEGVSAEIDNPDMQAMSYDGLLPNWRPIFEARQPVAGLVEDMQPAERDLLRPQGILSILVVPIFLDGAFWGLIGFDDCSSRRTWGQAEVDALEVASGTIGGAIRSMRAEEELRRLVSTDSLTGVSSRRAFIEQARESLERASRRGEPVSLMIMDLDHFKSINDNHGHPAGDQALVRFAQLCQQILRDDDIIGRTGGEEFAVVLHGAGQAQARRLAESLRRHVESSRIDTAAGSFRLSVSIGVAMPAEGERSLNRLLKRADDALYTAKRAGRNRVETADQLS
ncbi:MULTISPECIES: sensor domain-containing diguanylate cyclase [unclassified Wenzhouxiangella]|uniref:GGDEF domain-containing protein n=1 Tax=unclassified Wenzhouxiangella TaxID=2613841 RepID=UPI000E3295D8|nr:MULTISPECIES: sensor domain-containing diguanylate cyclase [unclassified Wenzhouxiangella]RFF28316.1 sensor domain-containing diguanylate cyclase [Wenzhouxiangella sp. 15181]RFP67759.1 sensor domain-containing diguanylate cyclase [Wenzhouxiangella sp. 15190]